MGLNKGGRNLIPITSVTYLNLKLMWLSSILIFRAIFTAATYSEDKGISLPRNRLYGQHIRIIWVR